MLLLCNWEYSFIYEDHFEKFQSKIESSKFQVDSVCIDKILARRATDLLLVHEMQWYGKRLLLEILKCDK